MFEPWFIVLTAFGYLALLFAIAYWGDLRAERNRSIINNPAIYALSMAVYATSWTFYGSVGRAASSGIDFLPIYLGPTLVFVCWWFVLAKIIRISKTNRITSIADFIASRYGKSATLGGLVAVIAVIGIAPYISLQLKAVSTSLSVLFAQTAALPEGGSVTAETSVIALMVTVAMAVFAILFGTRHLDPNEHHEGVVAAIAFESVVKLVAFVAVGLFVTFGLYDGFGDLFARAAERGDLGHLFRLGGDGRYGQWITLTLLSMAAIICLPRQFHMTVVENVDESHLTRAVWMFPLYLFVMNIFVLPIAIGGLLQFPDGQADADMFVLTLPMAHRQESIALLAFIGGLSAATGMIIISTIALSTMVCNDLVMPVLLRWRAFALDKRGDLTQLILAVRRGSSLLILLLGYVFFQYIGESYALVTIGLISFAAAAQFAPALIGGLYWKGGTARGALAGLSLGFAVWIYTLLLPSFVLSGWLPGSLLENGPFGIALLRPYQLFGLQGADPITHSLFWSMLFNIGGYFAVSMATRPGVAEIVQASRFVDAFREDAPTGRSADWVGGASIGDLRALLARFVGRVRAHRAFALHARGRGLLLDPDATADAELTLFAERLLAGSIGSASARVLVESISKGAEVGIDEVLQILDETSEVIVYSQQLEAKSRELQAATEELRAANERLQELDRLKDEFLSTVSHELRTPLTSIRSFGEILYDQPDVAPEERRRFLGIIIAESERLTRLINQLLDLARLEAGQMDWAMEAVDSEAAIRDAVAATESLAAEAGIRVDIDIAPDLPPVYADRDRLVQVIVNLTANAAKFAGGPGARIAVAARSDADDLLISVADNGPGIPESAREAVFERFRQVASGRSGKPTGSGLGLAICRQIVEHFGGRIWIDPDYADGARFCVTLPRHRQDRGPDSARTLSAAQ